MINGDLNVGIDIWHICLLRIRFWALFVNCFDLYHNCINANRDVMIFTIPQSWLTAKSFVKSIILKTDICYFFNCRFGLIAERFYTIAFCVKFNVALGSYLIHNLDWWLASGHLINILQWQQLYQKRNLSS